MASGQQDDSVQMFQADDPSMVNPGDGGIRGSQTQRAQTARPLGGGGGDEFGASSRV